MANCKAAHPLSVIPAIIEVLANEALDAVVGVVWVAPRLPGCTAHSARGSLGRRAHGRVGIWAQGFGRDSHGCTIAKPCHRTRRTLHHDPRQT